MRTALVYALLALVAIVVNIGAQDLWMRIYEGRFQVHASVAVGTLAGLAVKYVLDKRYVFYFNASDRRHDARTFVLYALMGLVTTMIFWTVEFGFHHWFESRGMRYVGGVIGLSFGYVSKYYLDKRFVFRCSVV